MPIARPRAVVFDMDGLLVDSERMSRRAWQAAARDLGFTLSDALYLELIGRGPEDAQRVVAERFGAGFDAAAFRRRLLAHWAAILERERVPFLAGAREFVAFVHGLGIPIGLATSSHRHEVPQRLGELAGLFATIVTRDDVARGKPSPDLYLLAARNLGVEPRDCVAFEDSLQGVRAAAAAGMRVVMIPDLVAPTEEVARLAHGIHGSLAEVLALLAPAWGDGVTP